DQGTAAPLSPKKREEIERFITELTECVANADRTAVAQPDTIVKPQSTPPPGATPSAPIPEPAPKAEPRDNDGGDDVVRQPERVSPQRVVARLTGGVAMISAGDLSIPVQPVIGLIGGYPIQLAPLTLELGAALSYTPLPYTVMDESAAPSSR